MTDEKYFEFWHLAQKLKAKYDELSDVSIELYTYYVPGALFGLLPRAKIGALKKHTGDRKRAKDVIDIFLTEFNRRHGSNMTFDEYMGDELEQGGT